MDKLSETTLETIAKRLAVYLENNRNNDNIAIEVFETFKALQRTGAITEAERFAIMFRAIESLPKRNVVSQQYGDLEE